MKTIMFQANANVEYTYPERFLLRKLKFDHEHGRESMNNAQYPEFMIENEGLIFSTDWKPLYLPNFNELRLLCPIQVDQGAMFKIKTPSLVQTEVNEGYKPLVIAEKGGSFKQSSMPYWLVFRFLIEDIDVNTEYWDLTRVQRTPTNRYFIPVLNYSKRVKWLQEQWIEYPFSHDETCQLLDFANIGIGQDPIQINELFPDVNTNPLGYRWNTAEKLYNEHQINVRLYNPYYLGQASPEQKIYAYFVVYGILADEIEANAWSENSRFALVPTK